MNQRLTRNATEIETKRGQISPVENPSVCVTDTADAEGMNKKANKVETTQIIANLCAPIHYGQRVDSSTLPLQVPQIRLLSKNLSIRSNASLRTSIAGR